VPGSALIPGGEVRAEALASPYRRDVNAIRDGQRLYHWYNCSGCHANGGGGMGPPLMDERWIYGSRPANLFDTIYEGRPGGMPAFGSKIPQDQIWKLVAYIEAMGE
jgi:cytochrome c oxidase cbb3-type subunit 3